MLQSADLTLQADLAVRLIVASVLGASIGLEREIHDHPAGMRTHLLVALGSAIFTVLSIYGFVGVLAAARAPPVDPTRIAAQVVSGIGFLGAGAILKYGTSIRGPDDGRAACGRRPAIGMAAGAGEWLIAVVGTFIVVFSPVAAQLASSRDSTRPGPDASRLRLRGRPARGARRRLPAARRLAGSRWPASTASDSARAATRSSSSCGCRRRSGSKDIIGAIAAIPDVELIESASLGE